jgi:hypothetical protein
LHPLSALDRVALRLNQRIRETLGFNIAQRWFQPEFRALGPEVEEAEAVAGEEP